MAPKNRYFHSLDTQYLKQFCSSEKSVLVIGFGQGHLVYDLNLANCRYLEMDPTLAGHYMKLYPELDLTLLDINEPSSLDDVFVGSPFDLVLLPDALSYAPDIHKLLRSLRLACGPHTRIVFSNHSRLWGPILRLGEKLSLKRPSPPVNWLRQKEIENFLRLSDFETISKESRIICPRLLLGFGRLLNRYIAWLPLIRGLCLRQYLLARPRYPDFNHPWTVTVLIPCKNERGNIKNAIARIPEFPNGSEIIFVEGGSKDGTYDELIQAKNIYLEKNIRVFRQPGTGKGDAVRTGFLKARGDVLMILDGDLTVPPEMLLEFYDAIHSGKGEFINGARLVYQRETGSMRFLNFLANSFFAKAFSFLIGQDLTDTLCGTKVLLRSHYQAIQNDDQTLGRLDPFGDFELILGATSLGLKIIEVPIRYDRRHYGETQISRFRHGLILLKMMLVFFTRLKCH